MKVSQTEMITRYINQYIQANIGKDLSLTHLAELTSFNATYLSRMYKQVTNSNLSDYIIEKRIEYASKLLSHTNMRVSQVAQAVGYSSAGSFSRVFTQIVGVSPREYRLDCHIGKEM